MFKNLFTRNKIVEDKSFTQDFEDALRRYIGNPNGPLDYEFHDKKGRLIPPSKAFEETYQEWKGIQSIWDKRSVIYKALDEIYMNDMPKSYLIERYVIDRYPKKAYQFHEKYGTDEDLKNPDYLASLAKCHFFLAEYNQSEDLARKALALDPALKKAKIVLADTLHLTHQYKPSHEIYDELIEYELKELDETELSVTDIIDFQHEILHSSVYAVALLSNDGVEEQAWEKAAGEFYHCPYFRTEHAIMLIQKNEHLRGMAKLISCTQEFPWFKNAVVNAHSVILQFREQMNNNDLWQDELTYLIEIITKNGWGQ